MNEVKIGSDIPVIAYTRNAVGDLQDADSGPTYAVYANGSAVLTGQTFTNIATGHYFDTCTISVGNGFAVGDLIEVKGTATVDSATDSNPLFVGKVVAALAEDNYSRIGANGAGLTVLATAAELAKVPKSDGTVTWNSTALANINAEVDTALSDYGALKPTTAGRTLDVTATGAAGIDWGNVENPTTTVGLSGTTVKTATDVETDTADIQSRIPTALSAGRMKADVELVNGNSGAAAGLSDFGSSGYDIALHQVLLVATTTTAGALGVTAKTDVNTEVAAALTTYDAVTQNDLDARTLLAAEYATEVLLSHVDGNVDAIQLKTDNLPSDPADQSLVEAAIDSAEAAILAKLQGLVLEAATIGATGNSTTAIHLPGLTYGDDEIISYLLVIRDVSEDEYHARWITDWVASTAVATVATLPFTPQNSTDTYWLLSARADVTGGSGLDAAGVRAAVGLASADLDTQLGTIDTVVDAVKAKTDNLPADPADASDIAASFSSLSSTLMTIAGYIDTEVAAIKAKTDNLPADPADASDIAASFSSVASTLSTIAGYLDTEVAAILAAVDTEVGAIKAKTDQFVFTVANQVDANALTGGGSNVTLADGAITAAKIGSGAITAAKFASGAIDAAALNADAVAEIQGGLSTVTTAQVLAQVNAALDTAISELGIGTPATTPSIRTALMLLYMEAANESQDTTTQRKIKNAAGTTIAQGTVTSATGSVTLGKLASP